MDLFVQRIRHAGLEARLQVRAAMALEVFIEEGKDGREQYEEDSVPPPEWGLDERDEDGDPEPVEGVCADEVRVGDLVPDNTLRQAFGWQDEEKLAHEGECAPMPAHLPRFPPLLPPVHLRD